MKFVPEPEALWTNYTEALGYCASQLPNVDFNACTNPTNDPKIVNIDNCGIKDSEGRSKCDPDGVRDDLQAALPFQAIFCIWVL